MVEKNYHQNEVKILATKIDDANEKVANVLKSFSHEKDDTEEKLYSFIEDLTAISTGVQEICIKLPDIRCPPRADTIVVGDETVVTLQFGISSTTVPEEETVVGFDNDAVRIVQRLLGGGEELEKFSIFGMPGSGKTTLARKLYNDPFITSHFNVRAWIDVSKAVPRRYSQCSVLLITDQIYKMSAEELCERLGRFFNGQRYLLVIDGEWGFMGLGGYLMNILPKGNGSKIMFVSERGRANDIPLKFLNVDESWVLLQKRVFGKESCPQELWDIGKQIAAKCHGLPLTIVVIARLLAKEEKTQHFWEQVAQSISSYVTVILAFSLKFDDSLVGAYSKDIEKSLDLRYINEDIEATIKKEISKQRYKKMYIRIPQVEMTTYGSSSTATTRTAAEILTSGSLSTHKILNAGQIIHPFFCGRSVGDEMLQRQTIDPEQGYGRLINGSVGFFESPTEVSVDQQHSEFLLELF